MKWFSTSTTLGGLPEAVIGEKQLREYYSGLFNDRYVLLSWRPTSAEVLPDGETGYTVGRYELHQRDANGGDIWKTGTYLTVWKLQEGAWKVVSDFNAPDPAP
jgi:ketosteroid isomerase-like protein